ncbi:MAG: glycosyltransferase family 4 protein [Pseudomonadota bacterium]
MKQSEEPHALEDEADELRVVIVSEHASARFGGEAALPLHYFRVLRRRAVPVWLVTHARTRSELTLLYPGDERILYVEDTVWHRAMWQIGRRLPAQISYFTTGFLSRLSTQVVQRRLVRKLIREQGITVVHQPMPVSPREPSLLFGFGVPVIIGPMNGGMDYPPQFRRHRSTVERVMLDVGRTSAMFLNWLMPGKRDATTLLVANRRTLEALPAGVCENVIEVVENGVDLDLWQAPSEPPSSSTSSAVTFAFMGRLVDWKAVDLLLEAFAKAAPTIPMRLAILGDGAERTRLEALADKLGVADVVEFAGWLPQAACAQRLREADCLVLPSLLECGGAVVLEAMSLGKPVIATAWGGPLDYLDASCGILITPTDRQALIDGLSAAMERLASSAQERSALGTGGREKVTREFDWDVKVDQVLVLYRSAQRLYNAAGDRS